MKKLIALILLAALAGCLCGCSSKSAPFADVPNPVATITLTDGKVMRFELFVQEAPNTVANFISLAQQGWYDGLGFFRVAPGVLAQTGDKMNDGTGNAGYTIQGEFADNGIENHAKHVRGAISMCRQEDYNSASCQFFIMADTYTEYDGEYAAFGLAMDEESLSNVDYITNVQVDSHYVPYGSMPKIASVTIDTHGYSYTPATIALPEESPAPEENEAE